MYATSLTSELTCHQYDALDFTRISHWSFGSLHLHLWSADNPKSGEQAYMTAKVLLARNLEGGMDRRLEDLDRRKPSCAS